MLAAQLLMMLLLANLAPRGYTAAEVSKRAGTTLVTVLGDPSSEPRLLGKHVPPRSPLLCSIAVALLVSRLAHVARLFFCV